ncbi:hypothetical protein JK176_11025 [Gluconobacter sp. Dm-73]|uniref:hypothetical protein n=1 Tax=Gluconobacter sp. Dm-73 TaxID=2799802 RepID=UPI001B8D2CEC|nr:hypothetical protein [Gluconobacter sp. Dm-73]MBS1075417.1 hypothetical protein [Gluconobacter sp. Dm-73]
MTETPPTLRLWFMDWFGWMLDHDSLKDALCRTPFKEGRLPGLSATVPLPFQLPCNPSLEKRISLPRPFPEMELRELASNHVVFFIPQTGTYLRSSPTGPNSIDLWAPEPKEWEKFFPMTMEMLRGLSLFLRSDLINLQDDAGNALPAPTLQQGFVLQFGDRTLPLFLNTTTLIQIGQIMPGAIAKIALTWDTDAQPVHFTVSRETPTQSEIV